MAVSLIQTGDEWCTLLKANKATSVASDWALSTVPIVALWNIQLSLKKKIGIISLMSLGYFTGATAIVRVVLLKRLKGTDVTWDAIPLSIWAGIETRLGIIGACIPAIRPLFRSSRFPSLHGWIRIFDGKAAGPVLPAKNSSSSNTSRNKNKEVVFEMVTKCEDGSNVSKGKYGHDANVWASQDDSHGELPQDAIMLRTEVALDDMSLHGSNKSRGEAHVNHEENATNMV
ncbi:hypothetical protein ACLMJK_007652 [Lecanora helva]